MKTLLLIINLAFLANGFAQNYLDQAKLVASDRKESTELGTSVAIDGDYAIVGTTNEYMNAAGADSMINAGAVYVYERQADDSWIEIQKLVNPDRAEYDEFGVDIAIDGTTLIIGAPGQDTDSNGLNSIAATGAAYIYDLQSTGLWTLTQKITCNTRQIAAQIGKIVDISGDYILIGSYNDYTDENYLNMMGNSGAIYMFKKNTSGTWIENEKIVASDRAANEWFAIESHLTDNKLIVGAQGQNHPGKAYVFDLDVLSGLWSEQDILSSPDVTNGDQYGNSVSINDTYAIVGARRESEDELGSNSINDAGAIYVYELNSMTGTYDSLQKIVMPDRQSYFAAYFGGDVEITATNELYASSFLSSYANTSSGAAYNFDLNSSGAFVLDEKFGAQDGMSADMVGEKFAVSGTTFLLSSRGNDTDASGNNNLSTAGAAYIVKSCESFATLNIDACESYLLPSGTSLITTSGLYSDTISNTEGCDSVLTLNISINDLPISSVTQLDELTLMSDENVPTSSYQWVDCDSNYAAIPGATSVNYTATSNSNFAVIVTNIEGCSDTSACFSITTASLDLLSSDNLLTLSPNPNNGHFELSGLNSITTSKVTILNTSGKIVGTFVVDQKSSLLTEISLKSGNYIIIVEDDFTTRHTRLIVQ